MSVGLKKRTTKKTPRVMKTLGRTPETEVEDPRRDEAPAAVHTTGKPAELEPAEAAFSDKEAPEARETSSEAPDAGFGRFTESSDWENRGRS